MKRLIISLAIILALWLPATAVFTGCQSPSQQRVAFNSVYSLGRTVDASYRGYLDLVIAGELRTNSVRSVAHQYDAFQEALRAATILVALNTNAPAPATLAAKAMAVTSLIDTAKKEDK